MPWQQLRTPSLPDTVRVAVTLDDFYFIFWLQTCLIGCFRSVIMPWGFLAFAHRAPLCTSHAPLSVALPQRSASPGTQAQRSTVSVLREESWASPEACKSDINLAFTSLSQAVHIFSGCRLDFGMVLTPASSAPAPAPSQELPAHPATAQTSVPALKNLWWFTQPCVCSHPGETWLVALPHLREKTYLLLLPKLH